VIAHVDMDKFAFPLLSTVGACMLPLSGYVRVSKVGDRSGEGFISSEVQEEAIKSWAARTGVQVIIEPHELNASGGTMDRPVFGSIMEKIRTGMSGGIVVYKLDRFARSLLGAIPPWRSSGNTTRCSHRPRSRSSTTRRRRVAPSSSRCSSSLSSPARR
jgi:Resolvase, N terminal domain